MVDVDLDVRPAVLSEPGQAGLGLPIALEVDVDAPVEPPEPLTAGTVLAASARPAPQPPEQEPGSARALVLMADSIWAGLSEEFADFISATRPAMCGVAMLVPW
ncbi:hypothetical protein SVIOM342S_08496 [Streptomyces violaceorubidus]